MTTFSDQLRTWRKHRRLSQLDLALQANVSARHISFLETGRARPSRDMIAHLGTVLTLPLDAINQMMLAIGFAPQFPKTPLDAAAMAPVQAAVRWMLDRHAPYPGIALDRMWTIRMLNAPARAMFAPLGVSEGSSLLDLTTSNLMPQLIENWPEVAHHSAIRLRAESVAAGGIPKLDAAAAILAAQADPDASTTSPIMPTIYRIGDQRFSLFGTIAQFSTIADETLDDFKIELFFPADSATKAALQQMADIS